MVRYSVHIKGLLLPLVGIVALTFLWNILGFIINPMLLDIPLHLVKYGLYALAGYIASSFFNSDNTEAVIHGGIAGGLGAIIEGLLVAPLFYGWFFYMPGFPLFHALYHIISLSITGAVFGFVGSYLSGMSELDFVGNLVQEMFDSPLLSNSSLDGVFSLGDDDSPDGSEYSNESPKIETDDSNTDQEGEVLGLDDSVINIDTGDGELSSPRSFKNMEPDCRELWAKVVQANRECRRAEKKMNDLKDQREKIEKGVKRFADRVQSFENEAHEMEKEIGNMKFGFIGGSGENRRAESDRFDKLKRRRARALEEKKAELDGLKGELKSKHQESSKLDISVEEAEQFLGKLLYTERKLYLEFLECMLSHSSDDQLSQLVNRWNKTETEIALLQEKLEESPKVIKLLKEEIARDEKYVEDMELSMASEDPEVQRGIYMHLTEMERRIAEDKLRLVELENLEQFYKVQIEKLENVIRDIRKEIENIGVYD